MSANEKRALDLNVLTEEGRAFAERILKKYPYLRGSSYIFKDEEGLWMPSIVMSPPLRDRGEEIEFFFDNVSGPTIRFGPWHDHIDYFSVVSEEECYEVLWGEVEKITTDQQVVCICRDNGNVFAMSLLDISDTKAMEDLKAEYGGQIHILSYSGKRDGIYLI
jgi:hypothetical protein